MVATKGRTLLFETENVVCLSSLSSWVLFFFEEKSEGEISSSKKESYSSWRSSSGSHGGVYFRWRLLAKVS